MNEEQVREWAKENGPTIVEKTKNGDLAAKNVLHSAQLWLTYPDEFTFWFLTEAIENYRQSSINVRQG